MVSKAIEVSRKIISDLPICPILILEQVTYQNKYSFGVLNPDLKLS